MPHANAPLTPTGRLRIVTRHLHDGIPIAHVAAEFRVSRPTVTTWVARYRAEGAPGLQDRSSRPHTATSQLDPYLIARIEELRRNRKWSARRIHHHLRGQGHQLHLRTVGRWLHRLGISRLRDLAPAGEQLRRAPQRIHTQRAGQMVHLDVKKLGRIPDGGGWRAHGRGTEAGLASKRRPRIGYTYLHSAVDAHTRLAYTEALPDERAATTIGFFSRARVFFAAHGIPDLERVVTDNGNNYRAADFTRTVESLAGRHQRIRPYTPRHNGKVERYNRLMVDEVLYARAYDSEQARRQAVQVWVNHYNYHRPHTACGDQPPGLTHTGSSQQRHALLHLGADRLVITRKGGARAVVHLPEHTAVALHAMTGSTGMELATGNESDQLLFTTSTGAPWARTDAARALTRLGRSAGIRTRVTPHVLRHTHATLALGAGVALHHLQDSLGHKDPRTTRRYDRARTRLENSSARTVGDLFT